MAKIKAAKSKKPAFSPNGLPCLILLISGMVLLLTLLYLSMRSS